MPVTSEKVEVIRKHHSDDAGAVSTSCISNRCFYAARTVQRKNGCDVHRVYVRTGGRTRVRVGGLFNKKVQRHDATNDATFYEGAEVRDKTMDGLVFFFLEG